MSLAHHIVAMGDGLGHRPRGRTALIAAEADIEWCPEDVFDYCSGRRVPSRNALLVDATPRERRRTTSDVSHKSRVRGRESERSSLT